MMPTNTPEARRTKIVTMLRTHVLPQTREQIVALTGLKPQEVSANLTQLKNRGLVTVVRPAPFSAKRRYSYLERKDD